MKAKELTLGELARAIPGTEVFGDPRTRISGACSLDNPRPGCLSFVDNELRLQGREQEWAGSETALITRPGVELGAVGLRAPEPRLAFARALELLFPRDGAPEAGVHPSAVVDPGAAVDPSARIGPLAWIGAGARIGAGTTVGPLAAVGPEAVVGRDCVIHPLVSIYPGVRIGDRVIIHSGAVLGADGYSYEEADGRLVKVPQVGGLVVEDAVEIGANTCIDRGAIDDTVIERGAKFDNLVQIGHNCRIGKWSRIVSQTGLSGSCSVGEWCILAGQVGVSDHVKIGPRSIVGGRGAVTKDLEGGEFYSGFPARAHRDAVRTAGAVRKLPRYLKIIEELSARVQALESRLREREDRDKP